MADYRFTSWLGVRGGQVKSVLGLYNDTEDMEFLHTWALMPQSIYPMDVRGDTIAHVGGDIYGKIQQRIGLDQISKAVAQMTMITQQVAANSEESASAAQQLSGRAAEMQAMVKTFTLNSSSSSKLSTCPAADFGDRIPLRAQEDRMPADF